MECTALGETHMWQWGGKETQPKGGQSAENPSIKGETDVAARLHPILILKVSLISFIFIIIFIIVLLTEPNTYIGLLSTS